MDTPKKSTVFVRDATGLVRAFSWIDGMIMGVAFFLPSIAFFVLFGLQPFLWPGSNVILTIGVFGTLILIPPLLTYAVLSAGMPRSGGDYVYVSRSLSPALGFGTSLVMIIFVAFGGIGAQGYFIPALVLAPHLATLGSIYNNPALVTMTQSLIQPTGVIVLGGSLCVIIFILLNLPPNTFRKLYNALFIFCFLAYPIAFTLAFMFSSNQQFISTFNSYATAAGLHTSYASIIEWGKQNGAVVPQTLTASLAASPFIMFTVAFPQQAGYIGGEIKHGSKQVPLGMAAALFFNTIMTAVAAYFVYNVVGYDFLSAVTSWGSSGAPGYPLPAAPYMNMFLAILYPNLAFNVFMLVAGVLWSFLLMIAMALMVSRCLFAWAFDRVIPTGMADLSERFKTPLKANAISAIGGFIFVVMYAFNFLSVYFNAVAAWTSAYVVVMIGAIFLPFTNKAVFEQSPKWARTKIGPLPLASVFGAAGTITLSVILYYIVTQPQSGVNPPSIMIIIGVYLAGIIAYYGARTYRKKQGLDLGLAFKEIPPE